MEERRVNPEFWRGKRVLLTGHTGFKGAWAALWLMRMGARVHGLSLAPEASPNLFDIIGEWPEGSSHVGDVRDRAAVEAAVEEAQPEIVIHMAAQALVRRSYREPVETFETNVMGTVRLLEALRGVQDLRAVLVVTSDKVYENREDGRPFHEQDALGGDDPYSASKAAAEICTASMARSFFEDRGLAIATARAGNVIGGGDFSEDRLVPDLWRAGRGGTPVTLRYPQATRPWQHVLDPIGGYLLYLENLAAGSCAERALNFGPSDGETMTVSAVAGMMMDDLGAGDAWSRAEGDFPKEKQALALDASLAARSIGWVPRLDMRQAVKWTAEWYSAYNNGDDMRAFTQAQLENFEERR